MVKFICKNINNTYLGKFINNICSNIHFDGSYFNIIVLFYEYEINCALI